MQKITKLLLFIAISIVCVKVFAESVIAGIFLIICFTVLLALFAK